MALMGPSTGLGELATVYTQGVGAPIPSKKEYLRYKAQQAQLAQEADAAAGIPTDHQKEEPAVDGGQREKGSRRDFWKRCFFGCMTGDVNAVR